MIGHDLSPVIIPNTKKNSGVIIVINLLMISPSSSHIWTGIIMWP
jgi:hypothetical protein